MSTLLATLVYNCTISGESNVYTIGYIGLITVLFFRRVECLHYWLHWFIIVLFLGESNVYTIGYIGL